MAKEMLKVGDKIPIGKFHISETNMRIGEPFPQDEQDEMLIANVRVRKNKKHRLAEPIQTRPEGDGYGVVAGKRKFQSLEIVGVKEIIVGYDCFVSEMTDEEAMDLSWSENSELLRKWPDPIQRAQFLSKRHARSGLTLRKFADLDGGEASTYSEWLKVLELSPKMQDALSKGDINFTDALAVARLKLGEEKEDELATVAENEGKEAFKKELVRIPTGQMKRGLRPGIYTVIRIMIDARYKPDMELDKEITKRAEAKNMKKDEYVKWFLRENIKPIG